MRKKNKKKLSPLPVILTIVVVAITSQDSQ